MTDPKRPKPTCDRAERIKLIVNAFRASGQEPSAEDIAKQYRYETGEDLPIEKELPWAT